MSPFHDLTRRLEEEARRLGFDLVRVVKPERLAEEGARLCEWLGRGHVGQMGWLARTFEKRADPSRVLSGVRAIVCLAVNYHHEDLCKGAYRVSKYAQGEDYHRVLSDRLERLTGWLERETPGERTLACVDTGPIMEKAWAQRAGLGWMGKHTILINPELGSWVFLAVLLTTAELEADGEPLADQCRTCTLCIEACPSGAIVEPYVLDARKCISYLTIEHRGPVAPAMEPLMDGWIFGCDVCQEVCPWNRNAPTTGESRFLEAPIEWSDEKLDSLTEHDFTQIFGRSAVRRARWEGFQRDLRIARALR
ncbi:MAG: tRNA epoxyqueuosine(34) reductase QueG [Nitrospirae bacterium]|nr:tRNA epoxyqueuosine(34) reductase QueG [Nitrospirota bacterium]